MREAKDPDLLVQRELTLFEVVVQAREGVDHLMDGELAGDHFLEEPVGQVAETLPVNRFQPTTLY